MFFVYGTSGQLFRGSMEQLRQIPGVGSLARSRRVNAVARDGRDVSEDVLSLSHLPLDGLTHKTKDTFLHQAHLAAYSQTQQGAGQRHPLSKVFDVMSDHVFTLSDNETVLDAWTLLSDRSIGQAPVVDAKGQLVGLLTRAELLRPERLPGPEHNELVWRAFMQKNVKEIMWTPVPSVGPDSDIRRVAQVLLDTGLPGLPVVDEQGQVNGFISRSDILRAVVTDPPLDLWG